MPRFAAALAVVFACFLAATPTSGAARMAPKGFMGTMADGPLVGPDVDLGREVGLMRSCGVESLRIVIYWEELQPYATAADIPPGKGGDFVEVEGVPTAFAETDRVVAAAAGAGLIVMPVVLRAPAWDREAPANQASPPKGDAAYARFLRTLVGRYGPKGSLWAQRPDLSPRPIRTWQVWNEPNIDRYWSSPRPFGPRYARLLKAANTALHQADPGAEVVMSGFANDSWRAMAAAYRAGVRGHFDRAAVHPFSGRLENVLKILRLNRDVLRRNGDGKVPIVVSELTWPSAKGKTKNTVGFETTEQGQATRLRRAYDALLKQRKSLGLQRVMWYTWLSSDRDSPNSFSWSGLRRLGPLGVDAPIDKPAHRSYCAIARRVQGR
ncbi:MAG: hypothetical protein JHC95_03175 [Solirubrobacteraceae bacterium]|nr:hypothetical protein [Solirubrobacteraceae bacterium]